ncbi:DUF4397 domain-containing protein [bacterium]|nr:DUF4397 domain-containing protein [candidate division CSSED10-310 bacterium]
MKIRNVLGLSLAVFGMLIAIQFAAKATLNNEVHDQMFKEIRHDQPPIDPPDMASIRIVHLSPDAPAVDIWANKTAKVIENLPFPNGTEYLDVTPGTYTFDVVPRGAGIENSVLTIENLVLESGTAYSAAAYRFAENLSALAIVDDRTDTSGHNIRVRAIHTADGVGEVDIWVIPEVGEPSPLWVDLGFGETGDALEIAPGAYTLGIDVDNDAIPDLVFDTPFIQPDKIANIYAVLDTSGAVFLNAYFQDGSTVRIDTRQPSRIRVAHLSPDAPPVDIWVNKSIKAVESLEFPTGTDYLTLDSGTYTFDVVPSGAGVESSVLEIKDLNLEPGMDYTAAAYNLVNSITAMALVDDNTDPDMDQIRLRAVHTAVGVGEVDIWVIPGMGEPSPLWVDLAFGESGDYIDVPSAAYTLGFDADNDASPDVIFDVPSLPASTVANVFAVTESDGTLFLNVQLPDGSFARIDPRNECQDFKVTLTIPDTYVSPGETFFVTANICNSYEPLMNAPFFALIGLGTGDFWFYPTWSKLPDIDYAWIDVPSGSSTIEVFPEFVWPDTGMSQWDDIHIFAAVLDETFSNVIGDYDSITFGFGPMP